MDPTGLIMSLSECWNVRLQLQDRLNEAMQRIKQLEDQIAATQKEATA